MLACLLPFAAVLLSQNMALARPPAPGPADTTRVIPGMLGQKFAWGVAGLSNGRTLRGYWPASTTGVDEVVAYYQNPPDASPARHPKLLPVDQVRWMRVQGQYSELLKPDKREMGRLAARRRTGAIELFVVKATPLALVNFLGPTPVLTSPASPAAGPTATSWYLRRPGGAPVLVRPETFAPQLAEWLAPDAELARRVVAGQPGYRLDDIESLVEQFNQRVK